MTRAKVRRERMGHIELAAPVTHIWYAAGRPSVLRRLLGMRDQDLEKVIYFAAYMITSVDEEARHRDLPSIENRIGVERKQITDKVEADLAKRQEKLEADLAALEAEGAKADVKRKVREGAERELDAIRRAGDKKVDQLDRVFDRFRTLKVQDLEGDELLYRELRDRFGMYFSGGMGAAAIQARLSSFDLEAEAEAVRMAISTSRGESLRALRRRLGVLDAFGGSRNDIASVVLSCVPVIPPDLRPMIPLDGGRFATSDLNDLYRRVINRNNRLKRLLDLGAREIIVNNEKRMLQEAVDALFDNGRRGRPVTGPGNRPLKSLSDMLKGKQGRFRQNLLGKRVDYSGRSVIVVGPQLKLHQCGLPKGMALELFKPFVMKRLVDLNHAQNIKSAKRMVERSRSVVWDVLEEVISEHPVMLNRAPTLHRLGIQAFEPQLIEGKAIQIHPLVCTAFNADFDGDQMAVHVPLSAEAQAEARILMLSSNNILSPANGRPITTPTQDMVLGIYALTTSIDDLRPRSRRIAVPAFSSTAEAIMAYDSGELALINPIKLRLRGVVPPEGTESPEGCSAANPLLLETTLGRALFNEALPADYPFVNRQLDASRIQALVNDLAERYSKTNVASTLDELKDVGFRWATRSGVTISFDDVVAPPKKAELMAAAEIRAEAVQSQYDDGLITDAERRQELIEIWTRTTDEVADAMKEYFPASNPVFMMVNSGACGNWMQVRQIAGMRGLVANPKGEIIPRPIKSNYREGLSVLEYFMTTYGARTSRLIHELRTAESGYLTRRLVDVSQDVIIREEDCGTDRGLPMAIGVRGDDGRVTPDEHVDTSAVSRVLSEDVTVDGDVLAPAGETLSITLVEKLCDAGVESVRLRSVLTCDSKVVTCATCYGRSLATGKLVDVGEAIGIIAAQSIGEPGTQLTMRTSISAGIGIPNMAEGLPRIVELFEARTPDNAALISEAAGRVHLDYSEWPEAAVVIVPSGVRHPISRRSRVMVSEGDHVEVGQQLTVGAVDPKTVLRVMGQRAVQLHLVDQVQEVYRTQGVSIHDKHIEVIVRQMLKRVTIIDSGDAGFLTGQLAERGMFESGNRAVMARGGKPASARPELMGITKASLATESWLSAASFQETTRVLTEAAIEAKSDPLLGLKENVIIGKLIPAGTGLPRYRNIKVEPTEEAKAAMYASFSGYDDSLYSGFGTADASAVPLEDYDYRDFSN